MNLSLLKRETVGAIEGGMEKRCRLRITDCFLLFWGGGGLLEKLELAN